MKLDLHVHTRFSQDGISSTDWIAEIIKRRRLDGLAITDHNTTRGWKSMKEAARKFGLELILGEEIKIYRNGIFSGEILGLFLNELIRPGTPGEVADQIRQQDGIAVISHPFHRLKGFRDLEKFAGKMDALETFNSRILSKATNERAFKFALRKGLGMTGGSDAHAPWEVGLAYTIADASDMEEFRKALKRRETRFSGRMNPPLMHLLSIGALSFRKLCNLSV